MYRKLSTFNASKELPSKVEVELLLMLWLNKVSEAVYAKRADEINSLLQSTDPKQRKKSKSMVVKSGGYPAIPLITGDICIGISDGQNLAALMLHYAPNSCSWNGQSKTSLCVDLEVNNDIRIHFNALTYKGFLL